MTISKSQRSYSTRARILPLLGWMLIGVTARAATIGTGDVTSTLGPTFFVDDALIGGSDVTLTQPAGETYNRSFAGLLNNNQGLSRVALTGFGFASSTATTENTATSLTLTFTYLGADEAAGGGDDVAMGSATGTYVHSAVAGSEYVFAFDTPITANLNITGTRFLIQVAPANNTANGKIRFKTAALTYETTTGPKFSVAGIVTPLRLNLAKYQTAVTDSVGGTRLASYLTDGVVGNDSRWQSSGNAPHWAQVVFPFPVTVGSAQVFSGMDDGLAPTSFKLQYLSNSAWVDVPGGSVTGNTHVERNILFTSPVTASSFRLYDSVDGTVRIKELALYAPQGGTVLPIGTDLTLNLADQRPALATANTAGNFARLAVDGRVNKDSKWQTSLVGSNSLEIDLRVSTKIGSAHLYSGSPGGVAPLAAFVLRYWDGSAWQDIAGGSVAGNTSPALVIPFTSTVTTSKLRLEFTNPGTTSVRELCVFPAATGNAGYPLGTDVIGALPSAAKFDDLTDTFYNLTNPAANRFMAVTNGAPGLSLPGSTTAQGQYQVLLNIGSGTYRLRNRATGNCLTGAQLSTSPGEPLVDAPYSALPHQDWILDPIDSTNFVLINPWSGLVIDTLGGSPAAGTALVQNVYSGAASQRWQCVSSAKFPKKGVGGTTFANAFHSNWAYNWGLSNTQSLPAGAAFNPMQWGDFNWDAGTSNASTSKLYSTWRSSSGALHLLGFNEPDAFSQSGQSLDPTAPTHESAFNWQRSVAEAVMLWPRLEAMDVPLVSPAPANQNGGWLSSFYTQADSLGYRVDYTALHAYPSPGADSADDLINSLQGANQTWGRPVWLTEFSFVNWSGSGTWTEEDNYNCLAEFLWRAESLPWLRKYALFVFTEDTSNPAPAQPWSTVGPRSNAFDLNGNLTPFGDLYAAWDNDASVRTDKVYHVHNKGTRKRLANTLAATPGGSSIRIEDASVKWTLVATGTSNRYFLVSARDGRRVSSDGTTVSQVAAGTTGTAVQWSLTESQNGWFYLGHPATSKRLKLAYNNTSGAATYTLVASTNTEEASQWRFIVPSPPPSWSGAAGTSWTTGGNWIPGVVPATGDAVSFGSSSTANLNTVLNQDFSLLGVSVGNPAGSIAIAGTHRLTVGANGIDLAAASQNLTITAPVVLGAPQNWSVAGGRTLTVNGGVSGNAGINVAGSGKVLLGAAASHRGSTTIDPGATLLTSAPNVMPNGTPAGNLTVNGTFDLNGSPQSINGLSGGGVVDSTSGGPAVLTVGSNDATDAFNTFNGTLQNTGGTLALLKTGAGKLTLAGANTHSGGFTNQGAGDILPKTETAFGSGPVVMNAGTLYVTGTAANFANPLTLNGATLRVGGGVGRSVNWTGPVIVTAYSSLSADGSTSGITLSGGLDLATGGHTLSSYANGTANTVSAPINGSSGTILVTFGTLNLNAANPFGGTFRSSVGGPLKIGDADAMQNATLDMNAADAGTVSLNNLNATLGALTGSRNLGLGSGTVSIGNNHLSTLYSGVLSGTGGSLVKTGNGTLTLSGANSYTGTTRVSSGTLALGANHVFPATAVSIGNATLDAATFTDSVGTLDVTAPTAAIHLGTGATLAFANSSAIDWTGGSLAITGPFVPGLSLRFGTTGGGLTATQLALISTPGFTSFSLTSQGYLTAAVAGSYDSWKSQITNGQIGRAQDADGDGFTNLQEFLFGTLPVAGNGSLVTLTSGNGNRVLRWLQLTSGASYTLQQSATLAAGSWVPAAPTPVLDPDQSAAPAGYDYHSATLPTASDRLFFRIEGVEN